MIFGTAPKDAVTATPTIAGTHGRAWSIDVEAMRRRLGLQAAADGMLASWVIEAPLANLAWHSYALNETTLLDIPSMPGPQDRH